MSVEPSEKSHSITLGRRLSLSLLCSDNHIKRYMSAQCGMATFKSELEVLVLYLSNSIFSYHFFFKETVLINGVYFCVFIKGPSVVVEPPSGTIVEQRMRGQIGDPVFHFMKGDPFGAQENSPEQPAVLEDS